MIVRAAVPAHPVSGFAPQPQKMAMSATSSEVVEGMHHCIPSDS